MLLDTRVQRSPMPYKMMALYSHQTATHQTKRWHCTHTKLLYKKRDCAVLTTTCYNSKNTILYRLESKHDVRLRYDSAKYSVTQYTAATCLHRIWSALLVNSEARQHNTPHKWRPVIWEWRDFTLSNLARNSQEV
jgi:hypothetical protein